MAYGKEVLFHVFSRGRAMSEVTVFCSASYCRWKSNDGYYNSCQHPVNKNRAPYGGIDRYYTEGCNCSKCDKESCEVVKNCERRERNSADKGDTTINR